MKIRWLPSLCALAMWSSVEFAKDARGGTAVTAPRTHHRTHQGLQRESLEVEGEQSPSEPLNEAELRAMFSVAEAVLRGETAGLEPTSPRRLPSGSPRADGNRVSTTEPRDSQALSVPYRRRLGDRAARPGRPLGRPPATATRSADSPTTTRRPICGSSRGEKMQHSALEQALRQLDELVRAAPPGSQLEQTSPSNFR